MMDVKIVVANPAMSFTWHESSERISNIKSHMR